MVLFEAKDGNGRDQGCGYTCTANSKQRQPSLSWGAFFVRGSEQLERMT